MSNQDKRDSLPSVSPPTALVVRSSALAARGLRFLDSELQSLVSAPLRPTAAAESDFMQTTREKAEAGDVFSQVLLSVWYLGGRMGLPKNDTLAKYWFDEVCRSPLDEFADGIYRAGMAYLNAEN